LTARISYAEVRAAFARARRERLLSAADLRALTRTFDEDWARYSIIEVSDAVVRQAASLSERHALRGYDAVQLAAALSVGQAIDTIQLLCSASGWRVPRVERAWRSRCERRPGRARNTQRVAFLGTLAKALEKLLGSPHYVEDRFCRPSRKCPL
jgi:hypothetical protein